MNGARARHFCSVELGIKFPWSKRICIILAAWSSEKRKTGIENIEKVGASWSILLRAAMATWPGYWLGTWFICPTSYQILHWKKKSLKTRIDVMFHLIHKTIIATPQFFSFETSWFLARCRGESFWWYYKTRPAGGRLQINLDEKLI